MRLLLIDDDPDIRFLSAFVLEKAGHVLRLAGSGTEGLHLARVMPDLDAILLDWQLGDLDGGDVLEMLLAEAPDRPVIFVTGRDDAGSARRLIDSGAAGVVTKPFDPETLAGRIEEILARARQNDTGGARNADPKAP